MKKLSLIYVFIFGVVSGMEMTSNPLDNSEPRQVANTAYIPKHYDHTEEFHRESVCCFRFRRWILQPASVLLQLASAGLIAVAQYDIKDNPARAGTFNAVGLGAGAAALVTNMLLLRIDNKLEDMDNYIIHRRNSIGTDQPPANYPKNPES